MEKRNKIIIGIAVFSLGISIFTLRTIWGLRHKNEASKEPPASAVQAPQTPTDGTEVRMPPHAEMSINENLQMPVPTAVSSPEVFFSPPSATTSQFIERGGVSDTSAQTPSDVFIAYSGDVLVYHNTTLGFEFGLPSIGKTLRLNDSGSYSRKRDALVWLWFTKNFDIATANFFVTPSAATSVSELSFDYTFEGYPRYMGTLSHTATMVNGEPALEETVSYESGSPDYPNTWKFIHILHDGKLYTFGAQIAPVQAINEEGVEQMIIVFKGSFRFL